MRRKLDPVTTIILGAAIFAVVLGGASLCAFELSREMTAQIDSLNRFQSAKDSYESAFDSSAPEVFGKLSASNVRYPFFPESNNEFVLGNEQMAAEQFESAIEHFDYAVKSSERERKAALPVPVKNDESGLSKPAVAINPAGERLEFERAKLSQYNDLMPQIYQNRGLCQLQLKRAKSAVQDLSRSIAFNRISLNLVNYHLRAKAYRQLGDEAQAKLDDKHLKDLEKVDIKDVKPRRPRLQIRFG